MKARIVFCLAAIAAISLSACGDSGEKQAAPLPPPAVTVVKVQSEDLRPSLTFTGRVVATDKVDLRARVEGFLEQRLFTEGADVKEGDLLYVIEQAPYKATIEQTKAAIQSAEASLQLGDVEVARQTELVARQTGTQARLDEVTAEQGKARGDVAGQKAALEKAELQLSYTEIRAPISGRIGRSAVSVGNFVGPSSGVLATIVSLDPIYVTFPVTQREVLAVRKVHGGDPDVSKVIVHIELADGSRYPQPGKIDFVDVKVDPGTDTQQVRAVFPNPNYHLVDGQLVTVVTEAGKAEPAVVIPEAARQIDQSGPYVLVVDAEKKIEVRRIETGQTRGANIVVTKGLSDGELVVTEGLQKVRPGQVVEPTEVKLQPEA
jgi:membrane fusion protein (multidrug efflux system)